jgi:hypothetical protein
MEEEEACRSMRALVQALALELVCQAHVCVCVCE